MEKFDEKKTENKQRMLVKSIVYFGVIQKGKVEETWNYHRKLILEIKRHRGIFRLFKFFVVLIVI